MTIKKLLGRILNCSRKLLQPTKWLLQYYKLLLQVDKNRKLIELSDTNIKHPLIICPHADDELIGCGSVLLDRYNERNVLYYQLYGYNNTLENQVTRDNEIMGLSQALDFRLYRDIEDKKEWLRRCLLQCKYDAVFIPSPYDWHWEHRFVFKEYVEVLQSVPEDKMPPSFLYSISVPFPSVKQLYVSRLGKQLQREKWSFFSKIYQSQKMPILRYRLQEKLNNNGLASELFLKVGFEEICGIYSKLIKDDAFVSNMDALKDDINNIVTIRKRIQGLVLS